MFKNFYTTGMSENAKQLERRFLKLRHHAVHPWKTALTTLMLLLVTAGATASIAAVGGDGLEYWNEDEIYFRDGVSFTVNVAGKTLPTYVSETIAGEDGNINVLLQRVETRDVKGRVNKEHILELSGSRGTVKMAANGHSGLSSNESDGENDVPQYEDAYRYSSSITFIEWNNPGYSGALQRPIMTLVDPPSDDMKYIYVHFGIDSQLRIQNAFITFSLANEYDNPIGVSFDTAVAEAGSLSFIGDFATDYPSECVGDTNNFYFTFFEKDYTPSPAAGIDIAIEDARTNAIVLNTDITNSRASYIEIDVYDSAGRSAGAYDGQVIDSRIAVIPHTMHGITLDMGTGDTGFYGEQPTYYTAGERYRVCVALLDPEHSVIYRWQEYVTVREGEI